MEFVSWRAVVQPLAGMLELEFHAAVEASTLLGYAVWSDAEDAYTNLYVHPDHRNQGVYTALTAHLASLEHPLVHTGNMAPMGFILCETTGWSDRHPLRSRTFTSLSEEAGLSLYALVAGSMPDG